MDRKAVLFAYMLPILLMVTMGLLAWSSGDDGQTIFKKMLVAPLFLLAVKGLRQFFPPEKDATRSLGTQVEFQLLSSMLLAAFLIFEISPLSEDSLSGLLLRFFLIAAIGTGINMTGFVVGRWNSSRERGNHPKR